MAPRDLVRLEKALAAVSPGPVTGADKDSVEGRLVAAWNALAGAHQGGMSAHKLIGRTEQVEWQPPELRFRIERHGALVLGSTRGEIQRWTVDVSLGRATIEGTSYRQLRPRAPVLRVGALADELVQVIVEHREHAALKWLTLTRCQVFPSRMAVLNDGYAATVAGRRKRFVAAVQTRLEPLGWQRVPPETRYVFELAAAPV